MKINPNQFAWIFLTVLLGLFAWGGYALYKLYQAPADNILSIENEIKLGAMLEEHTFSESQGYKRVANSYADSCIHAIEERLRAGMGSSAYNYDIKLVSLDDPNAFAIPGGKIFVHAGLIRFCNSPEELAAVLAHEMGHVEKRHTVNQMLKQIGIAALMAILVDGDPTALQELSQRLASNYFSRQDEIEADDFALALLERCGIRPATLGEVFLRMKHDHGDLEGTMNLLSTHPELEERSAKSSAYQAGPEFEEKKIEMDWKLIQQNLQ